MEMNQIQMYEILKTKLGEKETKVFIHLIDEKMDAKINERKHELATKEDISLLKEDISLLRNDMSSLRLATTKDIASLRDDMAELRLSTTKDIAAVRADMLTMRSELTRTIYATSLGQLFAIVASVISIIILIARK